MSRLKLLFMMNAEQIRTYIRLVHEAEGGDGAAACRLGDMYRESLGGLRYSPKQTFRWYSRSALAGDANGQNNRGACYEHGLGCEQSYAKAVRWYRLAVEQGEDKAKVEIERLEGATTKRRVRIVYQSEPGRHFGLVGVAGVAPPKVDVPEEERIRRELLEVLKSGETETAAPHTTRSGDHA